MTRRVSACSCETHFAEEVVTLIRFLAITGLELLGLMWRALAAALVGIFLASLARRRESDLLAAGGYSPHGW